jgi:hypothetical protein
MEVVGTHPQFVVDVAGPEELDEADRLGKVHVTVVIAVHEEDG